MKQSPNPQGKGQVPVLAALMETRVSLPAVPPKHVEQISLELFTSLFVLESDFKFKPVPNRVYWLYQKQDRFWLSPIAPHEWHRAVYDRYIGVCELQPDMTWTLMLSDEAARDRAFLAYIDERRRAFDDELREAHTLDEMLPRYNDRLPFYQRAYAFALAHSLGASMGKSGIRELSYGEALTLPAPGAAGD